MKSLSIFILGVAPMLLSGCWTFSETEYPTVSIAPGKGVRVKLRNFRTGLGRCWLGFKDYVAVEGHETMAGVEGNTQAADEMARELMPDMGWMLAKTASGCLVARTVNALKCQGYVIDKKQPQYVIELKYSGPVMPENDAWHQFWFGFCTLFTAEDTVVTWTAKLKVCDGATDKVLFARELSQTYEVTAWGPIPFCAPLGSEKIRYPNANSWAVTALTDRAIADATAFIAGRH